MDAQVNTQVAQPVKQPPEYYIEQARRKKIETGFEEVNSWPQSYPIYIYFGHGADLCNKAHRPLEQVLKSGCIYVTVSECGISTTHKEQITKYLLEDSPIIQNTLRHIYYTDSSKELAKHIEIQNEKNIRVKFPGTKYIVNSFLPIAYWNNPTYFLLSQSGLVERNNFIANKIPILNDYYIVKFTLPEIGITEDTVVPKYEFISFLFKSAKNNYQGALKEKLIKMLEAKLNDPILIPYLYQRFTVSRLKYYHMNIFLNEFLMKIPKKVIVNYFNGSVYPLASEVEKTLKQFPYEYISIDDFLKIKDNFTINNDLLLQAFPGIHFNVVCRSVSKNCLPKAILQRSSSVARNTIRRNVTHKKIPTINTVSQNIKQYNSTNMDAFPQLLKKLTFLKAKNNSLSSNSTLLESLFIAVKEGKINERQFINLFEIVNPYLVKKNLYDFRQDIIDLLDIFKPFLEDESEYKDGIFKIIKEYIHRWKLKRPFYITSDKQWFTHRKHFFYRNIKKDFPYMNPIAEIQEMYPEDIDMIIDVLKEKIFTPEEIEILKKEEENNSNTNPNTNKNTNTNKNSNTTIDFNTEEDRRLDQEMFEEEFIEDLQRMNERILTQKIKNVLSKKYKSYHAKQVALYNILLNSKKELSFLTDRAREELIDLLEMNEMLSFRAPIVKKIRHLIYPSVYTLEGIPTRKNRHKSKSQTKKNTSDK